MNRNPDERRVPLLKKTFLLLALLALGAAGCASASVAATVDTTTIQDEAVLRLAGQSADEGRVDGSAFRESLTYLVLQTALLHGAQVDYGIADLSTDQGRAQYLASASQREKDAIASEVAAGVDQGREQTAVEDFIVTQVGIRSLVRDAIVHDDAVIEAAWNEDRDALVTVCASHILVATEEEANDVIARIEAGEDFAAVADEVSLDTESPGGELPCPTHAFTFVESFANEVATSPVGEVSDPFQTEFGFHVVLVESRDVPASLEELKADPARWIPLQLIDAEYSAWLDDAVGRSTVTVRSQIGDWSAQLNVVTPPPDSP
jgi:parvulin-like peptidyl-prolyl isomerase